MGWYPGKLVVVLNIIVLLGYALIDCVVAGQILSAVSPGGSMSVIVGTFIPPWRCSPLSSRKPNATKSHIVELCTFTLISIDDYGRSSKFKTYPCQLQQCIALMQHRHRRRRRHHVDGHYLWDPRLPLLRTVRGAIYLLLPQARLTDSVRVGMHGCRSSSLYVSSTASRGRISTSRRRRSGMRGR